MALTSPGGDSRLFVESLATFNKRLTAEAEPIIQEAIQRLETQLRKELAAAIVALVQGNVRIFPREAEIVIVVEKARQG